ncbi:trafficking protein particle complex subunit 9-like [Bolinopsis microptera]|uniref:trafficking protein particle complex subunit 9-like n=1 Tax=Bolinopsis microptera TaxID=2820187 RepID=UPI003078F959
MNQSLSSRIDFNAKCDNSSRLHIVLLPVGLVDENFLSTIPSELSKVPLPNRNQLSAKFVLQSQPLLSDWSDVQYYRRPIGLLCITHADASSNLAGILPQYEKIKRRMDSTVIDSRCIIFSEESLMLPPDCIRPDIMVIQYSGDVSSVHCEELTALIGEFTQALYSVVVRNTIEMGGEKYNPQLLYSPYERSKSGLDEGKMGRKRIQARHKKHLGDMFLIIGKPEKANESYEEAARNLLSIGDSLWTGAAYEGQCCAIARMLQLDEAESTTAMGGGKLHSSQESLNSASSEPEMKSTENLKGLFRTGINHMEKIREASLIMLESTLKFVRLMIDLECKREACVILNSEIFYCYDDLTPVEKLQFFCTIALLYEQMGMHRKYSYFLRRAALESIHEKMLSRAYTISSSLLCNVIERYGVVPGNQSAHGWPQLQKLVLNDLISTSDKLANSDSVVKYGMCLLQNFYSHLDHDDQLRILNLIFKNNTRLGQDMIEAPNIPVCKKIVIKSLGKSLEPRLNKQTNSIFIFNPNASKSKEEENLVNWVCDEFGEVLLKLENPLLHSLQLFDIRCIVEGGIAECYPGTITIYPKQTVDIVLTIKPRQPGTLKLVGIKLQLCGVPSHFKVTCAETISVSKPMPLLVLKSDIPATLTLYEGEERKLSCRIANISSFPIQHIDVIDNCSRTGLVFQYGEVPVPLLPGTFADIEININTKIGHERRAECFDSRPERTQRGTIYENSSEFDEGDDAPIVRRARQTKIENVFVEENFSLSFRYYDKEKEYFRQLDSTFTAQINLLYQLAGYSISQHLSDSSKCQMHLSLASMCPQRMELNVAGISHFVDSGELFAKDVALDRVTRCDNSPTCHHRVKFSDLLDPDFKYIPWKVGDRQGRVNVIESVTQYTDLTNALKEKLIISCNVLDRPGEEKTHKVSIGTPITLSIMVTNVSDESLGSLLLFVRAFYEGSSAFKKMCDIPFIGTRDHSVESLEPHSTLSHEFTLMPMTCGKFSVEVSACQLPPPSGTASCTIQYSNQQLTPEVDSVVIDEEHQESPIIPRKIIMQYLNDGLPPPKYMENWKMRPSLQFEIFN